MGLHSSRSRSRSPKRQRRDRACSGSPRGRSRSPGTKRRFSSRSTSRSRSPPGTYAGRLNNGYSPTRAGVYCGRFMAGGAALGPGRAAAGLVSGNGVSGNGGCVPPLWVTSARLAPQVKMVLEGLYRGGKLGPTDLEYACVEFLELLGPVGGMAVLEEFATLDYFRIRNLTAFFIGICKRVQARAPPPPGRPLRGPDGGSPPPGGGISLRGRTLSRGAAIGGGGAAAAAGPSGGLSVRVVSRSPGAGPGMRRASPPLHFIMEDGSPPPRRWVSKSPPQRRWVSKSPPPRRFESKSPPLRRFNSKSPPRRRWVSRSPPQRRFESKSPLPRRWVSRSPPLRRVGSRSPLQRRWMSRSPPPRRGTSRSPQRRSRRVSEQGNSGSRSRTRSQSPPTSHHQPPLPPPPPPRRSPSPPQQQQQLQQGQNQNQQVQQAAMQIAGSQPNGSAPAFSANTMSTSSRTSASGDKAGGGGGGGEGGAIGVCSSSGAFQGDRVADSTAVARAFVPPPPPPPPPPPLTPEGFRDVDYSVGLSGNRDVAAAPVAVAVDGGGCASCVGGDAAGGSPWPVDAGVVNSAGQGSCAEGKAAGPDRFSEVSAADQLSPVQQQQQQQQQQRLRRQQMWLQQQQQQQQQQQILVQDNRQQLPSELQPEPVAKTGPPAVMSTVVRGKPAQLTAPPTAAAAMGGPVSPSRPHGHVQQVHSGYRSQHGHQPPLGDVLADERARRSGGGASTSATAIPLAAPGTAAPTIPAPASSGTSGSGVRDPEYGISTTRNAELRAADGAVAGMNAAAMQLPCIAGSSAVGAGCGAATADIGRGSEFAFGSGSDDGSGDAEMLFEPAALVDTRLITAIATALQAATASAFTGSGGGSGGLNGSTGGAVAATAAAVLAAGCAYVPDPPVPIGAHPLGGWLGTEVAAETVERGGPGGQGSAAVLKPDLPEHTKPHQEASRDKKPPLKIKQEDHVAALGVSIPAVGEKRSELWKPQEAQAQADGIGGDHCSGWVLGSILTQALAAVAGGSSSGCEGGVLRQAVTEHVKEALKPAWRANKLTRETFKAVAKRAVDRVLGTLPNNGVGSVYDSPNAVATFFSDARREAISRLVEALLQRPAATGNWAGTGASVPPPAISTVVAVAAGGGVSSSTDCAVEGAVP
ncbi:hypothetical protein Vafri_21349 [Volvox africanus]|uniref:Heterogeneous nuclear ribonucleoprotein Q acidic domain-containing protein n=1 Tax=Volvox africanus TaxID=51714 RepID=A0A8J4BSH8_9CHLO|nr:hypothetical protein Vafri_21349 [Volvox africanus]